MEIVKKNILSIICGGVAIVAIILYFYPVDGLLYSNFQQALTGDRDQYDKIHKLWNQPRKMPKLGPTEVAVKDEWFPNKDTIAYVQKKVDDYTVASNKVVDNAVSYSQQDHYLIEPTALPAPADNSAPFRFRDQYNEVMRPGGKPRVDPLHPKWGPLNLIDGVLQSTPPATDAEIQDALKKLWEEKYQLRVIDINNGATTNKPQIEDEFKRDTATFPQTFHKNRAHEHKIYMDPDALVRVPSLTQSATPSAADMWYGQMTYWLELDVCKAIAYVNAGAKEGVPQSPVKNLLEVSMSPGISMYVNAGGTSAAAGGGKVQEDPSVVSFIRSPTGRVSNSLYDVVEFRVALIVEARQVDKLLESLRYGKFLTVSRMEAEAVDNRVAEEQGYVYGLAPCVQLTLDCEELFMHSWTVGTRATDKDTQSSGPMPADVQKLLGITAPLAAPPKEGQGNVALNP